MSFLHRVFRLLPAAGLIALVLAGCTRPEPKPATSPVQTPPVQTPATEPASSVSDPVTESTAEPSSVPQTEVTPDGTVVSQAVADALRTAWMATGPVTDEMLRDVQKLHIQFDTWNPAYATEPTAENPYGLPLSDLSGLEMCVNLRALSLDGFFGTDLSPVGKLSSLTALSVCFTGNLPSDLLWQADVLTSLPLERLQIDNYTLSDLTAIGQIKTLRELWVTRCPLTDLSPLKNLTSLEKLRLGDLRGHGVSNQLTDLSPLAGLSHLNGLALAGFTGDLSPVAALPLQDLAIGFSAVDDFAPLSAMQSLVRLTIRDANFTDADTVLLQPMKQLRAFFWLAAPEGSHPDQLTALLTAIGRSDIVSVADALSQTPPDDSYQDTFAGDPPFWPENRFTD